LLLQKNLLGPRVWNLQLALLFVISMFFTPSAEAIELDATWSTTYRENIRVRVCFGSFLNYISELYDQATGWEKLIAAVQNVLDLWNVYGQVRVKFVYDGPADDSSPGCSKNNLPPAGYVYVRAEDLHLGDALAATSCDQWCGSGRSSCAVSFYDRNSGGSTDIRWSFDHTDGRAVTFQSTALHEFGHVLGFPDYPPGANPQHNSVMRYVDAMQHWPWHEDIAQLRKSGGWDPGDLCHPDTPYQMRQNMVIRHKRSTDGGLTWQDESDGSSETTNLPVGIAFGRVRISPTLWVQAYVLAWVGTDGMNTINTKITTGTWWGYKVIHWGDRSEMGVSVAWGNNKWVLVYAGVDEDYATRGRLLDYKWSYDGYTWYGPYYVPWCWSLSYPTYGSVSAPVITFDSSSGRFILLFVNWQTDLKDETEPYGKIRWYTSSDPSSGFDRCGELDWLSWNTPGIACNPAGACAITATDHAARWGNILWNTCAYIGSQDGNLYLSSPWVGYLSWNSRSEVSVASGYDNTGYYWYLLGYRGQDGSTRANTGRKSSCSGFTPWGDKRVLNTIYFGPSVASGWKQGQYEFVLYYAAP